MKKKIKKYSNKKLDINLDKSNLKKDKKTIFDNIYSPINNIKLPIINLNHSIETKILDNNKKRLGIKK